MPVLYWFAGIGQHGCPVFPPWTVGLTAHTTHPYNLVMTDTDTRRGMSDGGKDERDREREWEQRERERALARNRHRGSHLSTLSIRKRVEQPGKDIEQQLTNTHTYTHRPCVKAWRESRQATNTHTHLWRRQMEGRPHNRRGGESLHKHVNSRQSNSGRVTLPLSPLA